MKKIIEYFKKSFQKKHKRMIRVSCPEGYIEIGGSRDFVEPLMLDLRENCCAYREMLQAVFGSLSHDELIAAFRKAGYSEQEIRDFENDDLWDDRIYEKKN